jgi:hypothetical protein
MDRAADRDGPPRHSGRGAPSTRHDYGKQRPMSVLEAARKAKEWKVVRWRQGTKEWLEWCFVAMRVPPSHGFVRGQKSESERLRGTLGQVGQSKNVCRS